MKTHYKGNIYSKNQIHSTPSNTLNRARECHNKKEYEYPEYTSNTININVIELYKSLRLPESSKPTVAYQKVKQRGKTI